MKNMRKLIPAFAMLMVAAIMMSTASFAWFSMNTNAEATGMEIRAKSTGGLAIAAYNIAGDGSADEPTANDFGSTDSVGWTNGADAVAPTSHSGTKWYTANAGTVTTSDAVADDAGTVYTAAVNGAIYYYLQTKWRIKTLDDSGAYDVALSAIEVLNTVNASGDTATKAANANLAKALRIAVNAGGNWYYYAPAYSSSDTLYYVADPTVGDAAQEKAGGVKTQYGSGANAIVCGASGLSQVVLSGVTAAGADLDVYVYFEGEDPNCKSSNAVDLQDITINLTFTAQ